jgi:hypothetical protein
MSPAPTKTPARRLTSDELVLVVPAGKTALDDYERFSVYICQPDRSFKQTKFLAFYAKGKIAARVPRIVDRVLHVTLSSQGVAAQPGLTDSTRQLLHSLVGQLERGRRELLGTSHQVFLLSGPHDRATIKLASEIGNDLKTSSGRTIPFARSQRYVSLTRLQGGVSHTSDLM